MRKPLSGHLSMRIHAVKDVNHAITSRFQRQPETFVIIKVEDAFKGRTKATRTDKWTDETHNIEIEKANEIELTVYDKAGTGGYPTPIGMLWVRITDLVEEMRRKKIETELSGSQWVTAQQMDQGPGSSQGGGSNSFASPQDRNSRAPSGRGPPAGQKPQSDPGVIEGWFALEPVGRIWLSMSFSKLFQIPPICSATNIFQQNT